MQAISVHDPLGFVYFGGKAKATSFEDGLIDNPI